MSVLLPHPKSLVLLFSSTSVALYGYDQGLMSLINTNTHYLSLLDLSSSSAEVGLIVSVYYLGCAVGAILFSSFADRRGRKVSLLSSLGVASLGAVIMFAASFAEQGMQAKAVVYAGRVVMGLGVGGLDSVVPVYSSELSSSGARGEAMAKEFQANILGLNIAFAINLACTVLLGKDHAWAWRTPILGMLAFPASLLGFVGRLPESARWCVMHGRREEARESLVKLEGEEGADERLEKLEETAKSEAADTGKITYADMLIPGRSQFHPTVITIMGQVNQALTGYGAVSVYGPQIFQLLGYAQRKAQYLTQANYVSYLLLMTFAWLLIDRVGRRALLLWGSVVLSACFVLLALFSGLAYHAPDLDIPTQAVAIPGIVALFVATGAFGIGWLATIWLIPTEIYPTAARANGTAISVVVWGLANFAITLLTPVLFNNLEYFLFAVFAATNIVAGVWTWLYCPESGGRTFEENQEFFDKAKEEKTWAVRKVDGGRFREFPRQNDDGVDDDEANERRPLLQ